MNLQGTSVRFNSYGPWLRRRFGKRVHKVSVDGGFTCPNRDGTVAWGGCTYCNNESFRPHGTAPDRSIERQVKEGIGYLTGRYGAQRFLIYWQNYSNTYAASTFLAEMFSRALQLDSRIVGMTVGTRPDCVEDEKLDLLQDLSKDYYTCMEYGLESIFDATLRRVNRGHDFACYQDAVERTRARGIPVCSHVILGLPGESREQLLGYPEILNRLGIDFVKIHHLHVVKGTQMAMEYQKAPFDLFELEDWADLVCDFLDRLDPRIVIQRLFGWTPERYLVAPKWNRTRVEVLSTIRNRLETRDSWQGRLLGYQRSGIGGSTGNA